MDNLIDDVHQLYAIRYARGVTMGRERLKGQGRLIKPYDILQKSKWSLVKALFLAIRYYTLFSGIVTTVGLFYPNMTDNLRTLTRPLIFCGLFLLPRPRCTGYIRWELFTTSASTVIVQGGHVSLQRWERPSQLIVFVSLE
ncbi:hypothetical protein CPC08DRAFT_724536 [Agrocybe pediades]|nr:hypothetical protein CPC08DRAFT_724536 [Agrocybe pediades]